MTISPVSTRSSTRSSSLDPQTIAIKDEIATIWAQVQARVVQLAGGDPSQVQPNLNVDGVLSLLDKAQDAAAPKDSPVRSAFNTTLQFIDTVGSVIAGGAAEVGAPYLESSYITSKTSVYTKTDLHQGPSSRHNS